MKEIDYTLVIYQGGYGTDLLTDDYRIDSKKSYQKKLEK